jgi:cysteinyl-tRNA synthetase
LLRAREAARAHSNWPKADQLRTQVEELGWTIQDTPDGPQLEPL